MSGTEGRTFLNLRLRLESLRVLKRKNVIFGLSILSIYIFLAIFGPWIAPYDPNGIVLSDSLTPPNLAHFFGTDLLGRDIFSRVIYGARTSLIIGVVVVTVALSVGLLLGMTSGYFGGVVDDVIMRFVDILMSFPGILLAIALVSVLGPSLQNLLLAVAISTIPDCTRVVRAACISVKENEYVEAARASGESSLGVIVHYVLPNCMAPIIVTSTLRMATAILSASALSFLGLGVQPPTAEWGADLSDGRDFLSTSPYVAIFPGLALFFLVMGLNVLGDGLRDALDVKLRV
jgi:ABC-type dipeptide/oligopeptide/nickel transport system permease subunit